MINVENLYNSLNSLKNIPNKNEPLVFSDNRIISITTFLQEQNNNANIESLDYRYYPNFPRIEECQKALKDRIINLDLPLPSNQQEITASFLEETIKIKLIDEYSKVKKNSKQETTIAINQVLEENTQLNDINMFYAFVNSKLENYKVTKDTTEKKHKNNIEHLLDQIRIELAQVAKTSVNNKLFYLNIESEINILQNNSTTQLTEILFLLKEQNQALELNDDILAVKYNYLTSHAKNNVNLTNFKQKINTLVALGYNLELACKIINDLAKNSSNTIEFNREITNIFKLIHHMDANTIYIHNQLSNETKQFITQFQFNQAVKYIYFLDYSCTKAIEIVLKIVNSVNSFSSFYGLIHIQASADEKRRGYASKVQIKNTYLDLKQKLEKSRVLSLLYSKNISLKKEQTTRSREDFIKWANALIDTKKTDEIKKSIESTLGSKSPFYNNNSSLSTNNKLANLTSINYPSVDTDNKKISLSNMLNYGNTCWLNASLKFIYSFYGYKQLKLAINKKINDINKQKTIESQKQLKQLLISFSEIIDAMLKNESINIEIIDFLTNLHNYAQSILRDKKNKQHINYIDDLIINAFNNNNKINISTIKLQNANDFISLFMDFLGLNSDSNRLIAKNIKTYTIKKEDLNAININITEDSLIFNTEFEHKETLIKSLATIDTNGPVHESLQIRDFKDYFARKNSTSNIIGNEKIQILNQINNTKLSDKYEIPHTYKNNKILYTNIRELTSFSLNINYGIQQNSFKHIDLIKSDLLKMFPCIKLEVKDTETEHWYTIEAVLETMLIFQKNAETDGHYFTISIDINNLIFVKDDMKNTTIENMYYNMVFDRKKIEKFIQKNTVEQLFEYMDLLRAYPTNIGFRVVSAIHNPNKDL